MSLNLAQRPFVNRRPLQRLVVALWIVAGLTALTDAILYLDFLQGSGRQSRERILELESQIDTARQSIASLKTELGGYDLQAQAEHVRFLNEKIDERTFGWSLLFDRLAEALPRGVRLTNLSPRVGSDHDRGDAREDRIVLSLQGRAENDASLLELIKRLYANPAFAEPNLTNESVRQDGIQFVLSVRYLPEAPEPAPEETVEAASGEEAVSAEGRQEVASGTEEPPAPAEATEAAAAEPVEPPK